MPDYKGHIDVICSPDDFIKIIEVITSEHKTYHFTIEIMEEESK